MNLPFHLQLKAEGIPEPVSEYRFHRPRRWKFDLAWIEPQLMIALEIEGGIFTYGRHTRGKGFLADMEKYNEAALDGWLLLRVSHDMLKSGEAVRLVKRAFEMRTKP